MRYSVNRVYLLWTVVGVTPQTPSTTFTVQRSPTGHSDWETLAEGVDAALWIDEMVGDINILSASRFLVYRVGLEGAGPAAATIWSAPMDLTSTTPQTWVSSSTDGIQIDDDTQGEPSPEGPFYARPARDARIERIAAIRGRRHAFYLDRYVGDRVAVLKRKRFGTRCPDCYSPHARVGVIGKCWTCYGTTWTGGYHTPLITAARVREQPAQQALQQDGAMNVRQAQVSMVAFPWLEVDDVVVELETDKRWRVLASDERVLHSRRYKQSLTVQEIPRSAVEYRVRAHGDGAGILLLDGVLP